MQITGSRDWILERAVVKAVDRLRRRGSETTYQRAALVRERDRIAVRIRHLVDAVKLGRATETLLSELQTQEAALKALERRIAQAGDSAAWSPASAL